MYILHYVVDYFDLGGIDVEVCDTIEEVEERIKEIQQSFPGSTLEDFTVYKGEKLNLVPTQIVTDFEIK